MSWLITEVRNYIDDRSSDYFTDNEVENILDETRLPFISRELLQRDRERKVYHSLHTLFEGVVDANAGSWTGASTITLWASMGTGATEITPDAWNLRRGVFTFTTAQGGNLYLDAYEYDVHLASAELFMQLAARTSITPGVGETGGAIRGRAELSGLAEAQRRRAKWRPGHIIRGYTRFRGYKRYARA